MATKMLKSSMIHFPGAKVNAEILTDLLGTFTPLNVFTLFLLATTLTLLTAGISKLPEGFPSLPRSGPKH